ncbi:MAG: PIG-L family deacetylase [Planctomyces sp.]|nr:PIG-L family deacetylase [Planctomyces sp.]
MPPELPEPVDVIAVGAHPDDVEIGIGGTLARMVRQGYRVGIVDLTDGEPTPLSPSPEARLAEAQEAARILGVDFRITLPFINRRLFDGYEPRVALASILRRYRPRLVIGIYGKTPLASPDHWQASQITDAAIFYSRLSKWDAEFEGYGVHTIDRQLWYPLRLNSPARLIEDGAFVADISDTLDVKLAAIRAFASQFPPAKERVFRMVQAHAHFYGGAAGFLAGELLIAPSWVGVRDVVESICDPG